MIEETASTTARGKRKLRNWRDKKTKGKVTTQSMWQSFQRCEKRAEWEYVHKLRPKTTPEPLEFGSLFHSCMEIWYGRTILPPAMRNDTVLIKSMIDNKIASFYPKAQDAVGEDGVIIQDDKEAFRQLRNSLMCAAMLDAYMARYPEEDWEILAIEKEFRVPIRNPKTNRLSAFDLMGKLDLLVRNKITGVIEIIDHKTAKFIDANYILGLQLDLQIHLYAIHAAKHLGLDKPIQEVVYNVIKKCQLRGTKGETVDELAARMADWYDDDEAFFRHEGIPMDEKKCALFEEELFERSQVWFEKINGEKPFLRNTTACFNPKAPCPFTELCKTGSTMDEVQLVVEDQFVIAERSHGELEGDMLDPNLVTA